MAAAERIGLYVRDVTRDAFWSDSKTFDAVVRNLEVIGEAARQLDDEFLAAHPEVPWQAIRGFRNVLAHEYFGVDRAIVWAAAQEDVPQLLGQLNELLAAEPAAPGE